MPFGGLLGGFLSDGFGIGAALLVVGFAYFAATMLPLAIPSFRQFDKPALRPTGNQPPGPSVSPITTMPRGGEEARCMTKISMRVDQENVTDDVEPRMLLVQYLREKLGKTGTVIGCDTSNCGACTVHLNGRSVKSCNVLAVQADGARSTPSSGWPTTTGPCTRCRRRSASVTASSAASARRG